MHTAFTVTDIKLHINISFEYFWFLSRWHLTHKYIKPDWLITASHLRHLSYYKNMLKETWRLLFKTLLLKILVAWLLCIANVALRWVKYMNKAPFTLVESASGSSRSADPGWARGWQVQSGYGPLFSMGCQIETDCLSVSIRLSSDPIRQADGEWISSDFGRCQRTLDTCLLTSATP